MNLESPKPGVRVKKFLIQLWCDEHTRLLLDDEGLRVQFERTLRVAIPSITERGSIPAVEVTKEN